MGLSSSLPLPPVQLPVSAVNPLGWSHLLTRFGIEAFPLLEGDDPRLHDAEGEAAHETGASVWRFAPADQGGVEILLAWDWVVLPGNIVIRKNMQQVATNIELVSEDCSALQPPMPILVFASLIHGLPWHEFVLHEIAQSRSREQSDRFEWRPHFP